MVPGRLVYCRSASKDWDVSPVFSDRRRSAHRRKRAIKLSSGGTLATILGQKHDIHLITPMTKLAILEYPDPRLRTKAKSIDLVDAAVRQLADDMLETMYDAPGIGLAAIQVAQPLRLITMDLAKRDEDGETTPRPRVFINPEIISSSEELSVYEEGCLSIPEYYEEVERPAKVRVRFTDLDGKVHEEDADGLFATCIQHEIDHLNGVLFVDYLSKLKRDRVLKKFAKAAKRATE